MKLKYLSFKRLWISLVSFFQRYTIGIVAAFLITAVLIIGYRSYAILLRQNVKPKDLLSFFGSPKEQLSSTNNSTNFLLLGIRGEGTDSPNLADTIMIISYNYDDKTTSLISVPRDLWVPSLKSKINSAYHYGEESSPSAGLILSQAAVLETLGVPIHYTAVINFAMFKDIINLFGGIDVQNDIAFTDDKFPIPGMENALPESARYETISFPEGLIHMDGDTALKFVRSRHAVGDEGTDFARARRQRALISALQKVILTPNFLLDESKINALIDIVNQNINTNITSNLYPSLAKIALDTKDNPLRSIGISDRPDENNITILYNPPPRFYSGAYVLIPKDNNWSALKKYVENKLLGIQ